ncbi:regulator of chromosome condensation (RCC1) family protein [Actinidia rufa]|uniref:Regulator of chromosome condensation (RCC1) family protein n=1 Tax=Actinidia rufa TaxID=165716 RepID=A0A7J0H8X4_9ERIC|nr:regulator of chromosome condensation (RCC1) family protein [Actinidia rufa]
MDSGGMHHFVGADKFLHKLGCAQSGALGYGPAGQKSSAVPKIVDILDGIRVISVACGFAHSMVVVDRMNVGDRLDQKVGWKRRTVLESINYFAYIGITKRWSSPDELYNTVCNAGGVPLMSCTILSAMQHLLEFNDQTDLDHEDREMLIEDLVRKINVNTANR